MVTEATPASVRTTDNLRIAIVPSASNALSVAVLNGGTTKPLTFSLAPDGWAFPINETEVEDARYTSSQVGSQAGDTKYGPIVVKYVYGDAGDVARPALIENTLVKLTIRDSVANSVDWTIGQKVDTVTVRCGKQRKLPATRNGLQYIEQTLYVQAGSYATDQTLVA